MFVTDDDYSVVVGDDALKVISRASVENRANAELEAMEEISGYLRPVYDCAAIFGSEGDGRNRLIVMYTVDIALYHMVASLPQWVLRYARSATSAPSNGSKGASPGK